MSEPRVLFGCILLSTAILTLLTVFEALGVRGLPFGGDTITQAAIVYLTPLGIAGVYFAIVYILDAANEEEE